jgi:hypothetical protein
MIARRTGNKATENSYLDQLRKEDLVSDEERENLSEIAPRLLRNYWNRLPPPGGDGGRPRRL